ncbi:LacI family DNA-binding transcriptional regulator [Microbacterium binotii]|uniref:LacI family DNA-binding transcriptional regulator n=1 Tax=Microbacterium binotii TaxID=462710 RepID=UPI001F35F81E|nr:LacI family DNA-binding transcriptional regulator [Microbacterium binotii]UIN31367.1 LacI family transcriptional regulator [Microbacterium binotii]
MSERPRTRRTTVYDVAQEAGVSIASVSFAFRRPEQLSEATRERVLEAARRLGYAPSASARGLARGRTGILGLHAFDLMLERAHEPEARVRALRDLHSPDLEGPRIIPWAETDDELLADPRAFPLYVDEVQRGFALECWVMGRPVMLSSGSDSDVSVADTAGRVDGLAIFPSEGSAAVLSRFSSSIPIVLFSAAPAADGHHRVRVDNTQGMREMMTHLLTVHGVRSFAFVGRLDSWDGEERFAQYRESLLRAGIAPEDEPVDATVRGPDRMAEHLHALAAAGRMPRALVCSTDQNALAAMDVVRELGFRVPDDVIVTGFDGILAGRLNTPALTTVRQPMEAMGRAAARILAGTAGPLPEDGSPFEAVFAPALVVRASCGCG